MIVTHSVAYKIKHRAIVTLFRMYEKDIQNNAELIDKLGIEKTNSTHLLWLCDTAISSYHSFHQLDNDNSKVNRWMGFIQCVLIVCGVTTVDKERDRTRALLTAHRDI